MARIKGMHAELIKDQFEAALKRKDYAFFTRNDYNVNIIGVRSSSRRANKFDDMIVVIFKNRGEWEVLSAPFTTDPGWAYLKTGSAQYGVHGTAILVADQYRGVYKIDLHRGYEAVCQRNGEVSVYRDNNRDMQLDLDPSTIRTGRNIGINIHRAARSGEATDVNYYSAGCQVFKNKTDFDDFMSICRKARDIWGNSFTYTLIDQEDLDED